MIFNAISAAEMAALPKELQLDLLAEFHLLPEDLDNLGHQPLRPVSSAGAASYIVAGPKIIGSISNGIRKAFSSIACPSQEYQSGISSFAPTCRWMRRTNSLEAPKDSGN